MVPMLYQWRAGRKNYKREADGGAEKAENAGLRGGISLHFPRTGWFYREEGKGQGEQRAVN